MHTEEQTTYKLKWHRSLEGRKRNMRTISDRSKGGRFPWKMALKLGLESWVGPYE